MRGNEPLEKLFSRVRRSHRCNDARTSWGLYPLRDTALNVSCWYDSAQKAIVRIYSLEWLCVSMRERWILVS
jgi:hypothetical protein